MIKSCENAQKKDQSYLDQKEIKMQREATEVKTKTKELVVQKQAQNKKKWKELIRKISFDKSGISLRQWLAQVSFEAVP